MAAHFDNFNRANEDPLGSPYTMEVGSMLLDSNRVIPDSNVASIGAYASLDPLVAKFVGGDGWSEIDIAWPATVALTGESLGLIARWSSITEFIAVYINPGTGLLLAEVNGSLNILDTYAFTPVAGITYRIRLEAEGTALKGFLDGTERVSGTQGTATTHEEVGFAFAQYTASPPIAANRVGMDNFRVGADGGPTVGFAIRGS